MRRAAATAEGPARRADLRCRRAREGGALPVPDPRGRRRLRACPRTRSRSGCRDDVLAWSRGCGGHRAEPSPEGDGRARRPVVGRHICIAENRSIPSRIPRSRDLRRAAVPAVWWWSR